MTDQPPIRFEYMAIEDLRPDPDNPKDHDLGAIGISIERFGLLNFIALNEETGFILYGHGRRDSLQQAKAEGKPPPENVIILSDGRWAAPIIRGIHKDPSEARAYVIADNQTVILGGWNEPRLAEGLLAIMRDSPMGLLGTGFDEDDAHRLIQMVMPGSGLDDEENTAEKLDRAEEIQLVWQVGPGDLWSIPSATSEGQHRLICGDATAPETWERLFEDLHALWMWTDPPYGVNYVGKTVDKLTIQGDEQEQLLALLVESFEQAHRFLLEGAPVYVAHPGAAGPQVFIEAMRQSGWRVHQQLIWVKNSMVLGHCDYHFQHEGILYGWKGKGRFWYGGRDKVTTFHYDRPSRSAEHPIMKPTALVAAHLQNSSQRGDIGVDPFAGSGSTMAAAENLGRLAYCIDVEPKYCAVLLERMKALGLEPHKETV